MSAWWTERSREEMAAEDPFGGQGVFLPAPGVTGEEILRSLASRMGRVMPAVTWDGIGVWVDPGSSEADAGLIRERWDGGRTSGRE